MTVRIGSGFFICAVLIGALGAFSVFASGAVAPESAVRTWIVVLAALSVCVSIACGVWVHFALSRLVEETVAAISRIAAGDLATSIASEGRDELFGLDQLRAELDAQAAAEDRGRSAPIR